MLGKKMMISCKEASRLSSEQMDRPLSVKEYFQLKYHLWVCVGCLSVQKQLAGLKKMFGLFPQEEQTDPYDEPCLSDEVKVHLKSLLNKAGS